MLVSRKPFSHRVKSLYTCYLGQDVEERQHAEHEVALAELKQAGVDAASSGKPELANGHAPVTYSVALQLATELAVANGVHPQEGE